MLTRKVILGLPAQRNALLGPPPTLPAALYQFHTLRARNVECTNVKEINLPLGRNLESKLQQSAMNRCTTLPPFRVHQSRCLLTSPGTSNLISIQQVREGLKKNVKSPELFVNQSLPLNRVCPSRSLLIEPNTLNPVITIKQAREKLKEYVGSSKSFADEREGISDIQAPTKQSDLPERRMTYSYRVATIPVGSDEKLREKYINFQGTIRFGKVMEDLDTMAVWTSYTHYHDPANQTGKCPLSIVTAGVDRMDMKATHIMADRDIFLRSHVTHVGTSSLEVTIVVDQLGDHQRDSHEILEAKFLMVARDPKNKGKMPVNPLLMTTPEEEEIFKQGEAAKAQRLKERKLDLLTTPPTVEEIRAVHDLFKSTLNPTSHTFKKPLLPEGAVWMEDRIMKNVHISFPEQRNLYNKIFGGYLMRTAYELGWICGVLHCNTKKINVEAVDDILFRKPVEIGSLLFLSSQIVYTEGKYVQVRAHAEVVDPETKDHQTTNIFHYTFSAPDAVAPVMPKSYAEYMMYLDGKRHFNEAMKNKQTGTETSEDANQAGTETSEDTQQ